jgi:hypothetical protein
LDASGFDKRSQGLPHDTIFVVGIQLVKETDHQTYDKMIQGRTSIEKNMLVEYAERANTDSLQNVHDKK